MSRTIGLWGRTLKVRWGLCAGALIAVGAVFGGSPWTWRLPVAVVLFAVWYGAIYVINDLIDYDADRWDPIKRSRPIASGQVPMRDARAVAMSILVCVGASALLVVPALLAWLVGFLIANLGYSLWIKRVPYLDSIANALTYPCRCLTGMVLFGGAVLIAPLVAVFVLALILSFSKRLKELHDGQFSRVALYGYRPIPLPDAYLSLLRKLFD